MKTALDNAIPTIFDNVVKAVSNTPDMGKCRAVFSISHVYSYYDHI